MAASRLRVVAWVAAACSAAVAWPSPSFAGDAEPFSLTATGLLELAASPAPHHELGVTFLTQEFRFEFDERHRLTLTAHQIYRIDSPEALQEYGQVGSPWEPYRQARPELRARVVTPDGREHIFDIATIADETIATGDARKFDDLHYLRGPLPAVVSGSVVESLKVVRDLEPRFSSGSSYEVILGAPGAVERTSITVITPRSFPFEYRTQLLPDAVVAQTGRGDVREFTLRQGRLELEWRDAYVEAAGDAALWPRLEFSTGRSWEEVAAAYGALVEPAIRPDEVRALLPDDLPADPRQRLARLLQILHERVRYTGVFFGQGDIMPNPPSVTLERHFGDCKDKSVVLASLLQAAGMRAQLVLLNSGIGVDIDPELPGIGGFNHMIVYVPGENLWVDATAEFLGAGDVPYGNSGRWALLIGPGEKPLVRTPAMQAAENRAYERRIVSLADIGPGEIHVEARVGGEVAAAFRQVASRADELTREKLYEQFRQRYSARSVSGFELREDATQGDVTLELDLHHVEAATTDVKDAVVTTSLVELFSSLPYGLRARPPSASGGTAAGQPSRESDPETRTIDWVFQPFVSEFEIEVVPPNGFRSQSLPGDGESRFGPLALTQSFRQKSDGSVIATIRADSGRGRYSADEGRAFRKAYLEAEGSLSLAIRFEHESWVLAQRGEFAAALRRHRELIESEPRKAMPRVRASAQMLEFGLVDEAKELALRATQLEPNAAWAFNALGLALQDDELGRTFGGKFDRTGAMRAFREAARLDPDNLDFKLNLAALAEYDADGLRFGPGSDIDLAVENYRAVVAKRPDWATGTELLIQSLWQRHSYDEVISLAAGTDGNEFVETVRLAARVMTIGVDAALREDESRTNAASHRARIAGAMGMHWGQRNYDEARALMAAISGDGLPMLPAQFADLLRTIVRTEDLPAPGQDAIGTAGSIVRLMFSGPVEKKQLIPWLSRRAQSDRDADILVSEFGRVSRFFAGGLQKQFNLYPAFVRDVILNSVGLRDAPFTDKAKRVSVALAGARAGVLYLVPEGSSWKLLAMTPYAPPVAREARRLLDEGDPAGARAWLQAVRSEVESEPGSDSGPYKYFLMAVPTAKALDDPAVLRLATLALIAAVSPESAHADDLRIAAEGATTALLQEVFEMARFAIAVSRKDGPLAMESAAGIERLKPGSAASLEMRALSYQVAGRWQDAERASRAWIEQRPGDTRARQSLVRALNGQGRYADALGVLAAVVQDGTANASQLNNYAWQALVADAVDATAVHAAESSSAQRQQRDYSSSHTLACIYAAQGRIADARRVLLQLLDDQPTADPSSSEIWLVRGLIAEALGERRAAARSYRQIEKTANDRADSVYAIAAAHLAQIERQAVTRTSGNH